MVVRFNLVSAEECTGPMELVRLVNGTVMYFPVAVIEVQSPNINGSAEAVCVKDSIVDIVVENVKGVARSHYTRKFWKEREHPSTLNDISTTAGSVQKELRKYR